LTESVEFALAHRAEALDYAMAYAREIEGDRERSDRFVGMYVNDWTRSYGDVGRRAVQELLDRGFEAGVASEPSRASPGEARGTGWEGGRGGGTLPGRRRG
jgi:1,4-dihydroxy-6-naphthoate synthase